MNLINMKVSSRLAWGFGALLAMLCASIGLGVLRMSDINDGLGSMVNDRVPKLEQLNDISYRTMDNARLVRNIILLSDAKALAKNKEAYEINVASVDESLKELEKTIREPENISLLTAVKDARAAYERYTAEVLSLGLANKNKEATETLYGDGYKSQAVYFAAIRKIVDAEKAAIELTSKQAERSYLSTRNTLAGAGLLALVLGIVVTIVITRGLLKQLGGEPSAAAELARAVAQGDLTRAVSLKPGDSESLMAQLNQMQLSLGRVVSDVRASVDSVTTASGQIAAGNMDLSSRTEQQASSLQETASSMEELTATVQHNAASAHQANELTRSASAAASRGGEVVAHVVNTMDDISASSRKISDIIGVIDGIAFQTNILALNAAVEAARAGEQGRGFAVVAGEVRTLAQRSAEAAKEIKSLIGNSVEKVETGSRQAAEAGEAMGEIVAQVRKVTELVNEIAMAAQEQSRGISQVNQAVSQMDQVTQQNAALVEESAAAAKSLSEQAQNLLSAVSVFKLGFDVDIVPRVSPSQHAFAVVKPLASTAAPSRVARQLGASGKAAAATLTGSAIATANDPDPDSWHAF